MFFVGEHVRFVLLFYGLGNEWVGANFIEIMWVVVEVASEIIDFQVVEVLSIEV